MLRLKMYFVTFTIFFTVISFAYSLPLGTSTGVSTNAFGCELGEIDDCSKCFDVLLNEIISIDRNRYNLQRAFFPPDTDNPVFVRVTYYFTRNKTGNGSTDFSLTSPHQTWFWTQSGFYLFQPLESLQYTSLLFSDPSLRETNVSLYLQPKCFEADSNMIELLTQRLKLYAMEQEVVTRISDVYSAKGESLQTLQILFDGKNPVVSEGEHLTRYTISFQIIFPTLTIIFLGCLFHHLIENKKSDFFKKSREEFKNESDVASLEDDEKRKWKPDISSRNMYIYITVFGSLSFVVYVIVLDCLAVSYRNLRAVGDIFFGSNSHQQVANLTEFYFIAEYSIPHIMIVYDIFIGLLVVVGLICLICGVKKSWYYVLLGPCSCIIVHSYHILVGYIHSPYHATGILIFYAITVLVFVLTYRAAYYNLVHCFRRHKKIANEPATQTKAKEPTEGKQDIQQTDSCASLVTIVTPASQQTQANIKSKSSSCSRLNRWFQYALLCCCIDNSPRIEKDSRYWKKCTCHQSCILIAFLVLSLFVSGIMVFAVVLFIIVPINHAIEDAPNRLLNISQSILVFIAAAATYKLYQNKNNDTILDQLVKANTKRLKPNDSPTNSPETNAGNGQATALIEQVNPNDDTATTQAATDKYQAWMRKNKSDKKIEMAELVLDALESLKQIGQK